MFVSLSRMTAKKVELQVIMQKLMNSQNQNDLRFVSWRKKLSSAICPMALLSLISNPSENAGYLQKQVISCNLSPRPLVAVWSGRSAAFGVVQALLPWPPQLHWTESGHAGDSLGTQSHTSSHTNSHTDKSCLHKIQAYSTNFLPSRFHYKPYIRFGPLAFPLHIQCLCLGISEPRFAIFAIPIESWVGFPTIRHVGMGVRSIKPPS